MPPTNLPTAEDIAAAFQKVQQSHGVKLTRPQVDWNTKYPRGKATKYLAQTLFNYWLQEHPNCPVATAEEHIRKFQHQAIIDEIYNILRKENSLLLAGTGTGKTYMLLGALDVIIYYGYIQFALDKRGTTICPFPFIYMVNATAIDQIQAVVKEFPNCVGKVFVINYEQLRTKASLGAVLVKQLDVEKEYKKRSENKSYDKDIDKLYKLIKENDDSLVLYSWHQEIKPIGIIKDECQKLKNNGAIQTRTCQAFSVLTQGDEYTIELNASATPLVRMTESRTISLSCRPPHSLNDNAPRVDINRWESFINFDICDRTSPDEYSPAAMERFRTHLDYYENIIHVSDVKFKHKSMNKHVLINFKSNEWEQYYLAAFLRYLDELAKHNKNEPGGMAAIWAAQMAFRKAASFSRYQTKAEIAHQKAQEGKNVIVGDTFIQTQDAVYKELISKYGYREDQISLIRGGQTRQSRWDNVNKFQDEKSHIILVMQQAGGTALSLHHYKPRNKRPRFIVSDPVWSIIEQLQFLGRGHRINSASTTHQWILWLAGTIEEEVCKRLQQKALSMREMMRKKEDWSDLFVNESLRQKVDVKSGGHLKLDTGGESDTDEDDEQDVWNVDAEIQAENSEVEHV